MFTPYGMQLSEDADPKADTAVVLGGLAMPNVGKVYNGLVSLFLHMIPDKCKSWKVANTTLLNYWCRFICGKTNGKLCEPWCKIVERYGLWTLMITIGLPAALLLLLLAY